MTLRRVFARGALLLLAAICSLDAHATEPPPARIVAIGDVHGAIGPFRELLREAELIDGQDRWIGGETVLVQTGDLTDRGADVRAVIHLLMRLEGEATAAGGRVISLVGNHEGMNLARVYRDVGEEAYERFIDDHSEKRRKSAYKEWQDVVRKAAARRGLRAQFQPSTRDAWYADHPLGSLEYREALGPEGELGRWLRQRPTAVQVGDTLFLHAGFGPELEEMGLEEINALVAGEFAEIDRLWAELANEGLILPFFDRHEALAVLESPDAETGEIPQPAGQPTIEQRAVETLLSLGDKWIFRSGGPLWFRGYAQWNDEELAPFISSFLERYGVRRLVSGHTPSDTSRIVRRLDDRVILIDTGMYWSEGGPGNASAIEIRGENLREIYVERPDTEPSETEEPIEMEPAGALMTRDELVARFTPDEAPASEVLPPRILLGADGNPLPFSSDAEILEFLAEAKVVDWSYVGRGVTRPRRLVLERDGVRLRGIFHNVHILKERARLPERGVILNYKDSYRSQVAGYKVAQLLGLDNVPPAVLRTWNQELGSVALWIEGGRTEEERKEAGEDPPFPNDYFRRFQDVRIFDNLINNTDRNQGNIVFDHAGMFWYIDHTRSFGVSAALPDPDLVLRCSRSLWQALQELTAERVDAELSDLLSRGERKTLMRRRDTILKLLQRRIDQLGEDRVLFVHGDPMPGLVEG